MSIQSTDPEFCSQQHHKVNTIPRIDEHTFSVDRIKPLRLEQLTRVAQVPPGRDALKRVLLQLVKVSLW